MLRITKELLRITTEMIRITKDLLRSTKELLRIVKTYLGIAQNCYRFASPADPFQMFRDSMEVHWILDRVSQSVDASWTSGD